MVGATFFGEVGEYFGGESGVSLAEAEIIMEVLEVTKDGFGRVGERDIERELEGAADSCDAADDIGAIDGTSVPGVGGGLGDGGKHVSGRGCAVLAGNGNSFIEGAEEAFDGESFVIAFCERVEAEAEGFTHCLKVTAEFAIGVADDKAAEAHF